MELAHRVCGMEWEVVEEGEEELQLADSAVVRTGVRFI